MSNTVVLQSLQSFAIQVRCRVGSLCSSKARKWSRLMMYYIKMLLLRKLD